MQMGLLLWMNMVPSLALVVEWLDESTLGLLFGMMIIVGRLKDTVRCSLLRKRRCLMPLLRGRGETSPTPGSQTMAGVCASCRNPARHGKPTVGVVMGCPRPAGPV